MKKYQNKSILFSSQSFYPGIGGVSTLLLNLTKYLSNHGFNLYALHLEMPKSDESTEMLKKYHIKEYIIPKSEISTDIYLGYAKFKEIVYQHLHGLGDFEYNSMYDVPGYNDYYKLSSIYSEYLLKILIKEKIDIVHFQDYQMMPGIAAVPSCIKSVFSLHAPLLNTINPVLSEWIKKHISSSDKVILSIDDYSEVAKMIGVQKDNISVIPPIIDTELMNYSDEVEENINLNFPTGSVVITCVQRFDSKSGQDQLVRAFNEVRKKYNNTYLVLVGESSFTDTISGVRKNYFLEIKELVDKFKISDRVIFVGNVDYSKLSAIYNKSDIVVMLSRMECFGLAINESMYKGKPLVVTNVGGLASQVRDGINGFVVEVGNIPETINALSKLCESVKLRNSLGKNSKLIFMKEYDPKIVLPKYYNLYCDLLSDVSKNSRFVSTTYNLLR